MDLCDDDPLNSSDAESLEDDYYCDDDDDDDEVYGGSDDEDDGRFNDDDDPPPRKQQNFTILSESEIGRIQDEDTSELSLTLSVSRLDSFLILRHYNWNVSRVHDEWFADEGATVRRAVGLLETPPPLPTIEKEIIFCRICFETYSVAETNSAACGHRFCRDCWRGYIGTAINDGPGCLALRCPDPQCLAAVGQDIVELLVSAAEKEKYARYFVRSYIEDSKRAKWCPAPGCDLAVGFVSDGRSTGFDVCCGCGHGFCWNCVEEAHQPVGCETVTKWILKNSSEAENANWLLAYSKPCPKCKKPIEKNHGCMHMTCAAPCRFEFCWLCLGDWSKHGESTGGFYACNRYEEAKKGELYEEKMKREMAKNSLEQYTHYYERWASNKWSMQRALAEVQSLRDGKLDRLREKLSLIGVEVKFVVEAWEQIVKCRRVLSWTYAYGYYIPEEEEGKKELFEYLQGQAEAGLERLHNCAEIDLKDYFEAENGSKTSQEFVDFRSKLSGLTIVTRNYFENLARALETGLQEVDSVASSKNRKVIKHADDGDSAEYWSCSGCSHVNSVNEDMCEVCDNHR